jgi:hypothetical protein
LDVDGEYELKLYEDEDEDEGVGDRRQSWSDDGLEVPG